MDEAMKKIQEWKDKAIRYDNIKERDSGRIKRLAVAIGHMEESAKQLKELMKDLDVFSSMPASRDRTTRVVIQEMTTEVYKAIQAGTQVSQGWIGKVYPDVKESTRKYVFDKVKALNNVEVRRDKQDGRKLILYAKKDR